MSGRAACPLKRVAVPKEAREGIEAVRVSGLTNMLDATAVARIAEAFGYEDTAGWILANREAYARAIFFGFEAAQGGRP